MAVLLSASLIGAVLVAAAAPGASAQNGLSAPFVTVAAGRTSGILQPLRLVIRDREAWLALWRRHAPAAQAPPMDFSREMVIAMFAGSSPATFRLTITRIIREQAALTVWYVLGETRPLPGGAGLSPAAPFHIARLARSPLPVSFSPIKTFPVVPQP